MTAAPRVRRRLRLRDADVAPQTDRPIPAIPIPNTARNTDCAALFHAPDTIAYADIEVNGHSETWSVRSSGCRD